jgi:hypothetical protein
MTGMMVPGYRAQKEWWNERRMTRDDPWRNTLGGGGRRELTDSPSGERLTRKEAGRVASNEWMMRIR